MSLEKFLSIVAFILLCVFLSFLIRYVPLLDLGAVLAVTLLLAAYDLFIHKPE
ncbi:hypothetical protein U0C82_11640 [Fulvimarina sp. 2208YS6-2-32]|uniref:Uncharacterized protein n=1 Tax=Fulvimarina uroteuthidis TaxID=3098149 RepID=A0ABU5I367_9HYPH|nr:hypothetical protein [Fulvimarina sp. 2208YS6-2-32]MDY8109792.1 hypothetical protein [Fulvimarina sp. 2208YS6-2-32]